MKIVIADTMAVRKLTEPLWQRVGSATVIPITDRVTLVGEKQGCCDRIRAGDFLQGRDNLGQLSDHVPVVVALDIGSAP